MIRTLTELVVEPPANDEGGKIRTEVSVSDLGELSGGSSKSVVVDEDGKNDTGWSMMAIHRASEIEFVRSCVVEGATCFTVGRR